MASVTIPNLPALLNLLGSAQIWVNQNGIDYRSTIDQIAFEDGAVLITQSGAQLFIGGTFSVKTSLFSGIGTLPLLAEIRPGQSLVVQDIDYNAGNSPFIVAASGGDMISDHGILGTQYSINISNTISTFIANSTVAPYVVSDQWCVITFGS